MGDHTDACPITWEETGGDQAQTTTEQQQTLVTEEAAQTEEKTVLPAPMFPEAASGSTATFPGTMPRGFWAPVSGLRAAAPGADPPGAGRLPGVPDPLPPGRGRPARCWRAGWRRSAGPSGSRRPIFSHLRGALLAGGGEVPAGDFVLRDSPPAVCPGAGHHGRLSHRHGRPPRTPASSSCSGSTPGRPGTRPVRSVPWWSRRRGTGAAGKDNSPPAAPVQG